MSPSVQLESSSGFSLIEAVISVGVLTVGAVGMAALFVAGMKTIASSPAELTATQKAQEAIEDVFSARDSRKVPWAQLKNTSHGGIFLTGDQPLKTSGPDGVVNTADDGPVEQVVLPGPDQTIGTADDRVETLALFTRKIEIAEAPPDDTDDLRSVTVTITYPVGSATRTYTLTTYISAYS